MTKLLFFRSICPISAIALGILWPHLALAQSKNRETPHQTDSTQFLRVTKSDGPITALETAITRYQRQQVTVDLIAAVHIGEGEYYETLNELFDDYDVVLYELVAEPGTRIPAGAGHQKTTNPISFLQTSAKKMLGLESQLQKIDYTKKQFEHADLSPQQLAEKMKERGQTPVTLALSALGEIMSQAGMDSSALDSDEFQNFSLRDLSELMTDPVKAKQFMARQFVRSGQMELGLGKQLNQLVVVDRNQAAMKVLKKKLEAGDKKIAIFYGAAHMPDFEARLHAMSFAKKSQSWLTAWDLTASHGQPSDSPMSLLRQLLGELDD